MQAPHNLITQLSDILRTSTLRYFNLSLTGILTLIFLIIVIYLTIAFDQEPRNQNSRERDPGFCQTA